ncbi:MAG: membrane protein insertase YidC [Opitutales bacterium]
MDKKNTFLGIIFIAAGVVYMFWQASQLEEQRLEQLQQEQALANSAASATASDTIVEATREGAFMEQSDAMLGLLAQEVADTALEGVVAAPLAAEKTITLSNAFIEAEFTTRGGAIRQVHFLRTKRGERDDYIFNEGGYLPALSLSLDAGDGNMQELNLDYVVESQTSDSITFVLDAGDGLIIRRTYQVASGEDDQDPYVIRHATTFVNRGAKPKALSSIYFNLGTSRPIARSSQPNYLNVGFYNGDAADFIAVNKLTGSNGFLGIGASAPKDRITKQARIEWASVKNQFFTSVLSSERLGQEVFIYPVEAPRDGDGLPGRPGISGSVGYAVGTVAAGASNAMDFEFYVGPKEFKRLQSLGNGQDLVMQFGFLGFFSKLLLAFMYGIHSIIPSWGWSIVIMTICIKLFFWPLTAKASKSQKRMAKIQGPMQELKEKYKDNPQKMQQETLKLFKEHQVNPLAGCLPMLIQMPIFLGLFYMLRTASELRHEPFLWVADLSQPDTILEIGGFPINLLPLIMGGTMFLQMHMMPVSPTADPMQQKIFKFMPLIFLVFLYSFSSGLTLYWTVQNVLTIVQQKITNSRIDKEDATAEAAGTSTPTRKLTKAKRKK